jgi:hypothetical protein
MAEQQQGQNAPAPESKEPKPVLVRVRAKEMGFHQSQRRRAGVEFDIDPKHFCADWMEKVEPKKAEPKA